MLFRISAAFRWRLLRGRSLRASAKRAGGIGVASFDILYSAGSSNGVVWIVRLCSYVVFGGLEVELGILLRRGAEATGDATSGFLRAGMLLEKVDDSSIKAHSNSATHDIETWDGTQRTGHYLTCYGRIPER